MKGFLKDGGNSAESTLVLESFYRIQLSKDTGYKVSTLLHPGLLGDVIQRDV